jgi:hypothetical protein
MVGQGLEGLEGQKYEMKVLLHQRTMDQGRKMKVKQRSYFLKRELFFFFFKVSPNVIMFFVDSGSWLSWQSFFVLTETNYCFCSSNK